MEPGAAELYDQALLGILQHVGNVQDFLRVLFGFLYRKTDFYRLLRHPSDRMGFPPGAAQALVLQVMRGRREARGGARPWSPDPDPSERAPVVPDSPGAQTPASPPLRSLPASVHPLALPRTRLLGPRLQQTCSWGISLLLPCERGWLSSSLVRPGALGYQK